MSAAKSSSTKSGVTPMMAQFLEIKADHPDALLFYRMGDFYEMFFQDAILAAEALDIALTKRGKHLGEDIPMCGVPVHSAESYFLTLIRKGFRVAVCEQLESPEEAKKRGSKSVVKRGVVRLVTPGTLTEDALLSAQRHNYLTALAIIRDTAALAWVDLSTGDLSVQAMTQAELGPKIAALAPSELLLTETSAAQITDLLDATGLKPTYMSPSSFDSDSANARLCAHFQVATLESFAPFAREEIAAMGALLDYIALTQIDAMPALLTPKREDGRRFVQIDAATRRNLELTRNLSGGQSDTLLSVVNATLTNAGGRLLEQRISNPSTDLDLVNQRLDAVDYFVAGPDISSVLKSIPDMDRALSRLALGRGGPRDLAALRSGLLGGAELPSHLDEPPSELLSSATRDLGGFGALTDLLDAALADEPPLLVRDGGFVADGYDPELDRLRSLRNDGKSVILSLQAKYAETTGIQSLKIKHNNVLGYFVETPSTHAERMLGADYQDLFIHRQTTANAVRFTTLELSEMETKIHTAAGDALGLELAVFDQLRQAVLDKASAISQFSRAIAEIDLAAAFARIAMKSNWVRPQLSQDRRFLIQQGRHPVVEAALLAASDGPFIPNDCDLGADGQEAKPISLLTGPNMAGKSTYLRQNALIALLAQSGSFVPAEEAQIGMVSQIFSRVGASDDLARGRSTFMVEMVETAAILNQADKNALVILDEIGRGTATYDGLSIAWATLEHLHDVNQCRALFATHYHELTNLRTRLKGVENATVSVKEHAGDIIFLHEVKKGAADRSYGVQVAKLAGLPDQVINRARAILDELEGGAYGAEKVSTLIDDLPLFTATPTTRTEPAPGTSKVEEKLAEIYPDDLSPRQALDLIYALKKLAP